MLESWRKLTKGKRAMHKIQLPGRCWWIVQDRFLAGGYPYNPGIDDADDFLRRLLATGIDTFVDLTEEDELTHYQPIIKNITDKNTGYRRFEIRDYSIPDLATMQAIVQHLNDLLAAGHKIYLHCRGGVGRTGTVVGCWLCSQGKSGEEALAEVARLFAASNAARFMRSPETDEQRQFVLSYALNCR